VLFIAFLDNFAMLPTVAPYAEELGARLTGVGVAVGAYSLTNLVFNLVGGALLDRVGRRRLVVVSLLLVSAAMLAYPLAGSLQGLIVVRLLHGVGGGILVPAVFTVLGDLAPAGRRGQTMGRAGAIIGVAAVVGPAAAGILREAVGFTAVFMGVAAASAIGAIIAARWLVETAPAHRVAAQRPAIGALLRRPGLQAACLAAFVFTGAVGSLAAFLPVHVEAMGLAASRTGGLFTLFAVAAVAVMLSRLAGIGDVRGAGLPMAGGLSLYVGSLALLSAGPGPWLTALAVVVFGLGYGVVFPAMAGAVMAAAEPRERGTAYGLFLAFFSLGFVVVPPLGGLVGDAWAVLGPFVPAALLCALGAVTVWRRRRR
jgi:MFS transporter, DHA1 family, multidrug resistance protein